MRGRRRGILLLGLLLCACGRKPDAGPDFSPGALRERVELLRPDVERIVGARIEPPVAVEAMDRDAFTEVLAAELESFQAAMEPGPRGDELKQLSAMQARLLSRALLAKVRLSDGAICVCPENFTFLAGLDPSFRGIATQEMLDVILLHELTHVHQHRRYDLKTVIGAPRTADELTARMAVVEGHAQRVARRASERRGLTDAFALLLAAQTKAPPSISDPALKQAMRIAQATSSFTYVSGEAFLDALARERGEAGAVECAFRSPPRTIAEVSRPEEYLRPPAPPRIDLDRCARHVGRFLAERWVTVVPVPMPLPALRATLAPLGDEAVARAERAIRSGVVLQAQDGRGGRATSVALFLCAGPEAAREFLGIQDDFARRQDETFADPGGAAWIADSSYAQAAVDGAAALVSVKTVETDARRVQVANVVWAFSEMVGEVTCIDAPGGEAEALRIALAVAALLRSETAGSPWEGLSGAAALEAFRRGLSSDDFTVRFRALRNLRRAAEGEAENAARSALADRDPLVREEALRTLSACGLAAEARAALQEDPDPLLRSSILRAEAEDGSRTRDERVGPLLDRCSDRDPLVRRAVLEELKALDAAAHAPLPVLLDALRNGDAPVRRAAAALLPEGEVLAGGEAEAVLRTALADREPDVRKEAVARLGGTELPDRAGFLAAALTDVHPGVRRTACETLSSLGEEALPALPELLVLLRSKPLREEAARAIARIGPKAAEAAAPLRKLLSDGDRDVRFEAARALARIGRADAAAVKELAARLSSVRTFERRDAAEELRDLGESAAPAVDALRRMLEEEPDEDALEPAVRALGRIGPPALAAVPALDALAARGKLPELVKETLDRIRNPGK